MSFSQRYRTICISHLNVLTLSHHPIYLVFIFLPFAFQSDHRPRLQQTDITNTTMRRCFHLPFSLFIIIAFSIRTTAAGDEGRPFRCISVKDYYLKNSQFGSLDLTESECARRCVDSSNGWDGYHYDNGKCFPLAAGLSWHESTEGKDRRMCIYRENPKCDHKKFPYSFGRSRYLTM